MIAYAHMKINLEVEINQPKSLDPLRMGQIQTHVCVYIYL